MTLAERQRLDVTALPQNLDRNARRNFVPLEDWRIFAICRHIEAIGEALPELLSGQLVVIHGNPPPPVIGHHAQIIDAVGMVGMVMGEKHAVEPADAHVQQLLAEVRRAVDEHIGRALFAFPLHQHRAAPPPVLRVCRIARAPDVADTGHAAGRAAAEDGELERHAEDGIDAAERGTFLNRRKKLSVVAAAISASLTPRTAASRFAVCTTLAGSLVRPRKGSGAR